MVRHWLRSLVSPRTAARKRSSALNKARRRLTLEVLESRVVPSIYVVTTTADNVSGSLRDAINLADANPGPNTIQFDIGSGTQYIVPATALPPITNTVTIDGTTQPGYNGSPLIVLQGTSSGTVNYDGLTIYAANCVIRGLVINAFYNGITIESSTATGNLIAGDYLGTTNSGNGAHANAENGVQILNAPDNAIGDANSADYNVISGNGNSGVVIAGAGAFGNTVEDNDIGLNVNGSGAVANADDGVDLLNGANDNTIGGTLYTQGNAISGNAYEGVLISGTGTSGNQVLGNYIGTNGNGNKAVPNEDQGVYIGDGATDNVVGGTAAGAANVLSGNDYQGVYITDPGTAGNVVEGNLIGLNAAGTKAIANQGDGIDLISDATDNTIGAGNVISGNDGQGVWMGQGADDNFVEGCYLGTDSTGVNSVPNGNRGVQVSGADDETIGGTATGAGNLIAGNPGSGIIFLDSSDNVVQGNTIGVNSQGTPLPNGADGVRISEGSNYNVIGGTAPDEANLIAANIGNTSAGEEVVVDNWNGKGAYPGTAGTGNSIRGNSILEISNGVNGILLYHGANDSQAAPTLSYAVSSASTTTVTGTVSSAPDSFYLDLYASPPGTVPEGVTYLGGTTVPAGQVQFTVSVANAVPAGDVLTATITDCVTNNTSEISSAINVEQDSTPPTSSVNALPQFTTSDSFTVSWSGSDNAGGSGIASYDVYVSDDGGAFTPWQTDTTQTSALFTGVSGHTYGFYSVATDYAGNVQPTPSGAQASTTVDTTPPTSSIKALPAYTTATSFTLSWSGSDNPGGSGIAYYDIYVSYDHGATFTDILSTTLTSTTFNGGDGDLYEFYSIATDHAGNSQPTPSAAQATTLIDVTPPASTVVALPTYSPANFTVTWYGSDGAQGSGIASYDVYVSDNGGSFTPWLTATTATSATFDGQDGHTYRFYSVATDRAGNTESTPAGAEASTSVDAVAPSSTVTALPTYTTTTSFTVAWSGSDNPGGSGLAYFDLYVSDDGAPFKLWQATTATSATFNGVDGHTYGFYSVAIDNAGNRQATPSGAEATTLVDVTPPSSSVTTLPGFEPASFTVSWSGTDGANGSGIAYYDVYDSDNGGAFTHWQTATTATAATFTGQDGHTYAFYSVATDRAGNVQSSSGAQTHTTVDATAPVSSVAALPAYSPGTFTVRWSGSDGTGSGIASYAVYVSDDGGAFALWQTATAAGSASYVGQDGHTYAFYSVATDRVGNRQATPAAGQASTSDDAALPTSRVTTLPAYSSTSFTVAWSGSDSESRIAFYDIYVSDDGGGFTRWQTATTATSAFYTGQDGHTYGFYSVATDNVGNRQATPTGAEATTLVDVTAPTSSVTTLPAFSPARFTVTWSGNDGASGSGLGSYAVFVSDNGGPFAPWQAATTATSATFTGQDGHTYGFYSVATDQAGNVQPTPAGAQASTTDDATPPSSSVAALPAYAPGTFTVSWSGSDGANGAGIAFYDVYVSDDGGPFTVFLTNTALTSAPFTGQLGHSYGFYSVATDRVGNRQATPSAAQASTTDDAAPPTSRVTALPAYSATSFTVTWSGSDGTGSGIAAYEVYVADDGGPFTPWLTATTATSATYTGLDGHTYGFYSVATDNVGNRQPTPSAAQAKTLVDGSPPTSSVAALPTDTATTSFTVRWSGTDGANGSGIAGYDVYVSDDGGAFTSFMTDTQTTSASFSGQDGHTYGFFSVAIDNAGNRQQATGTAQATTLIDVSPPSSSVAALSAFEPATFTVSWSGSDGANGSGIAFYDVYVSDDGGAFTRWQAATTATSASFRGQDGQTYAFYSVATDNAGNRQQASAAQASTTVDTTAPTSSVAALPAYSATTFSVAWSGSDGGGSGVAFYDVYVSDNGGPFSPWQTATTGTAASFTGQDGHTYGFYSVATDNVGNRQATPGVAETTTLVDVTRPTSQVAALPAYTSTSFTVTWSGSDGLHGSGIAAYDVYVSDDGGPFTAWQTATPRTSATFTGQDGHTYGFSSVATDNAGNREDTPSSAEAATLVDVTPPTSSVAALPAYSGTTFTVSWSGSDGPNGSGLATYDVYVSDDGGPFTPFVTDTTATSASFTGVDGQTYGFYSSATDRAGKREVAPASPEAATLVDVSPPTSSINPLPAVTRTTSFTVSWTGADGSDGSGVAAWTIFVSVDGGPASAWLTNTALTSATYASSDGHTYAFSSQATDRAGNVEFAPSPAQQTTVLLPADRLVLSAPSQVITNGAWTATVNAVNPDGLIDTAYQGLAALALVNAPPRGKLSGPALVPIVNGSAVFAGMSLATTGTYDVVAASSDILPAAAASISVSQAPQFKVTLVPATAGATASGQPFLVTLTAQVNGKADAAYVGTVQLTSTDPQATLDGATQPWPAITFLPGDGGTKTLTVILKTLGKQTVTAADTSLPTDRATSKSVTVTGSVPLVLDHFAVTGLPATDAAGTAHTVTITAMNAGGQVLTGYFGTVTVTSSDPSLQPFDVTLTKGVGKAAVTLASLGLQTLTVTGDDASGTEANITVVSPATRLSVLAATTHMTAGDVISLRVQGFGGTRPDLLFADTLRVTTTDPNAEVAAQPLANGAEQFQIVLTTAGTQTITVTDLSRPAITGPAVSVHVSPGPVAQLDVTGYPLVTLPGISQPYTVTAVDAYGNRVTNGFTDTVQFARLTHRFVASDHGTYVFKAALSTTGLQSLTPIDNTNGSIGGTPANIEVVSDSVGLAPDPITNGAEALIVLAPTGGGTVLVTPANSAGTSLTVSILAGTKTLSTGTYTPSANGHLIVCGQAGKVVVQEQTATIDGQGAAIAIPAVLLGGTGTNTLSAAGSNANNLLLGGAGNDVLTGGTGRDILIGGGGADTLNAGAGGDILSAGSTSFDANLAALASLLAEWASSAAYATRVQDLFGAASAPPNGTTLLDAASVSDDPAHAQLNGGNGLDWFWFNAGADALSGARAGEVVTLR